MDRQHGALPQLSSRSGADGLHRHRGRARHLCGRGQRVGSAALSPLGDCGRLDAARRDEAVLWCRSTSCSARSAQPLCSHSEVCSWLRRSDHRCCRSCSAPSSRLPSHRSCGCFPAHSASRRWVSSRALLSPRPFPAAPRSALWSRSTVGLGLALTLIPTFGPSGAAAASSIAFLAGGIASIAVYRRAETFPWSSLLVPHRGDLDILRALALPFRRGSDLRRSSRPVPGQR